MVATVVLCKFLKGVQQIQASKAAFAAILTDGWVVSWRHQEYGGDSGAVQDQLKGMHQIQASKVAFADGSVVAWGNPGYGGDSRGVEDQRRGVQQI